MASALVASASSHRTERGEGKPWSRLQTMYLSGLHGGCTNTVRECTSTVDSGRRTPCRTGEWKNLRQQHAGPDVHPTELHPHPQLSHTPTPSSFKVPAGSPVFPFCGESGLLESVTVYVKTYCVFATFPCPVSRMFGFRVLVGL